MNEQSYEFITAAIIDGDRFVLRGSQRDFDGIQRTVARIGMAPATLPGFYLLQVDFEEGKTRYFFVSPSTLVLEAKVVEAQRDPAADLVLARALPPEKL